MTRVPPARRGVPPPAPDSSPPAPSRRVRVRVTGRVQGVGFRPFVFALARRLGLAGFVLNDSLGVLAEVEGEGVEEFLARLVADAPPLACVERLATEALPPTGESGFTIRASAGGGPPDAAVSPDAATCDACLAELFDPADRRYRYPFINCTGCGPRFTIVTAVPYDRPSTTMAAFTMCRACRAEYQDPGDRRFHAQPNACPDCGPRVRLVADRIPAGRRREAIAGGPRDAISAAAAAVRSGAILAVKGIGGFHLACRADDEAAVSALRARKHREDRPFAIMVGDLDAARALVELDGDEIRSRARPIVIAPRRGDVAPSVAPRSRELGVMLPYSPLHHLLLADAGVPLVMTSGNVSDEPIAFTDEDALRRLAGIADLFLLHDRPIRTRTDDSVLRGRRVVRRSRGFVPEPLPLPAAPALLATGAELKSTFTLARDGRAWVGHHIGDLRNVETLASFADGVEHFERLFAVAPQLIAHDMHPDYLSTSYALAREGEHVAVQHHHAHLAAALAEHGEPEALGAIFDGTGYGTDGTIWGGELLLGGPGGFTRAGHLRPVRMPGGESAIREPWRMACAWLAESGLETPPAWANVRRLAETGLASPVTTSMGRLFDAVAALCGLRETVTYEGQAAIELEAAADAHETAAYPLPVTEGAALVLDPRPAIAAIVDDLARGAGVALVSARFHNAVARATAAACREVGAPAVVLSGGVFQNALLLDRTTEALRPARVLTPVRLPCNDGGISYGQAAVAAALHGA
nr:carbamoyltransferase HypF [Candidatus Solirubrobacter pratensis]